MSSNQNVQKINLGGTNEFTCVDKQAREDIVELKSDLPIYEVGSITGVKVYSADKVYTTATFTGNHATVPKIVIVTPQNGGNAQANAAGVTVNVYNKGSSGFNVCVYNTTQTINEVIEGALDWIAIW